MPATGRRSQCRAPAMAPGSDVANAAAFGPRSACISRCLGLPRCGCRSRHCRPYRRSGRSRWSFCQHRRPSHFAERPIDTTPAAEPPAPAEPPHPAPEPPLPVESQPPELPPPESVPPPCADVTLISGTTARSSITPLPPPSRPIAPASPRPSVQPPVRAAAPRKAAPSAPAAVRQCQWRREIPQNRWAGIPHFILF
jgi:hypothetical protein